MAYTKSSDAELLQAALVGYQHQHAILSERIAEITRELGGRAGRPAAADGVQPREALVNAFCHSGAKRIELELEYSDIELHMRIRDDGCGIDPQALEHQFLIWNTAPRI